MKRSRIRSPKRRNCILIPPKAVRCRQKLSSAELGRPGNCERPTGAKDGDSLGQEAVAMDLRRRSKNRVVEAMARIVALLPIGQEPARPNCDVDLDRVDSVAEGL
jgi:hypothetical protein